MTNDLNETKNKTIEALKNFPGNEEFTAFAILQCTRESGRSFLNYEAVKKNVVLADYKLIACYDSKKLNMDTSSTNHFLEDVFYVFNMNRPKDFRGHSLSVSDIVAVKTNGKIEFHFTNSFGFVHLKEEDVTL